VFNQGASGSNAPAMTDGSASGYFQSSGNYGFGNSVDGSNTMWPCPSPSCSNWYAELQFVYSSTSAVTVSDIVINMTGTTPLSSAPGDCINISGGSPGMTGGVLSAGTNVKANLYCALTVPLGNNSSYFVYLETNSTAIAVNTSTFADSYMPSNTDGEELTVSNGNLAAPEPASALLGVVGLGALASRRFYPKR
jgi:MYXO-CTERM domain-containing protein